MLDPEHHTISCVSRYIFIVVYMFLCEIGCKGTKKIAYMQKKLNEDEKKESVFMKHTLLRI